MFGSSSTQNHPRTCRAHATRKGAPVLGLWQNLQSILGELFMVLSFVRAKSTSISIRETETSNSVDSFRDQRDVRPLDDLVACCRKVSAKSSRLDLSVRNTGQVSKCRRRCAEQNDTLHPMHVPTIVSAGANFRLHCAHRRDDILIFTLMSTPTQNQHAVSF